MRFYRRSNQPRYGLKKRQSCLGGCGSIRNHDSGGEANYCDTLKILKKSGQIEGYVTQQQYVLHDRAGNRCGFHIPDFVVSKNGKIEVHEFKNGLITKEWSLKKVIFSWCYPDIEYLVKTPKDCL